MSGSNPFIRRPREEYVRLTGLSLWVPTDEQVAKAKEGLRKSTSTREYKPRLSLVVECEPLSYRLEGGKLGNVTLKYIPITWNLDESDLPAIREQGLHAVPGNKIVTANESGTPDDEKTLFGRWLKYLLGTNHSMWINEQGQPETDAIGKVFKVIEGESTFFVQRQNPRTKKWEDRDADGKRYTFTERNTQFFTEAAPNYVQDPESVRVIQVRSRDEDGDEAAVSAMTNTGVDNKSALREAARASGLVGRNAKDFANPRQALKFCDDNIGVAPILVSDAVNAAAMEGRFIEFLCEQDAIIVDDSGVIIGIEG